MSIQSHSKYDVTILLSATRERILSRICGQLFLDSGPHGKTSFDSSRSTRRFRIRSIKRRLDGLPPRFPFFLAASDFAVDSENPPRTLSIQLNSYLTIKLYLR